MYNTLNYLIIYTVTVFVAGFVWSSNTINSSTPKLDTIISDAIEQSVHQDRIRMVLAPTGNTVRYLVREQLAGFDFPNDAVGETNEISGAIVFNREGEVIQEESKFVANITGLKSDRDRRDGFIQRNTLESERFPTVELVPIQTRNLSFPLPTDGLAIFDIIGNLSIKDVTQPTSWRVNARFVDGVMTGTARTEFTFDEFGLEKPRVGSVLSVADAIRLEFDFTMNIESLASQ